MVNFKKIIYIYMQSSCSGPVESALAFLAWNFESIFILLFSTSFFPKIFQLQIMSCCLGKSNRKKSKTDFAGVITI